MSRRRHTKWIRTQQPPRSAAFGRRLRFEPLEDRRLLTVTVDTLVDEDDGIAIGGISLRDAIVAAAPGELIDFAPALTASGPVTITLTHGELLINQAVQISGPLTARITIDASGNDPTSGINNGDGSRVFAIDNLDPLDKVLVSIRGLTLTGADFIDGGGAIFNEESLTVSDSIISGNAAHWGGGIYNAEYGQLTVLRSQITGNSADTRNDNSGSAGGIDNWGGAAALFDTTISGNSAPRAGGLRNANFGSLTVDRSTISGNLAEITGGGIFTDSGDVTIRNSTISGNQANVGGGLYIFTALQEITKISNSTISGNIAPAGGGGISNQGGTTIVEFSTITRNVSNDFAGSGVVSSPFPSTTRTEFRSSIIAANFNPQQPQAAPYDLAVSGSTNSLVSLGYNLVGIGGFVNDTFDQPGDQIIGTANPLLGPLADNGGPTKTHALLAGSPARDAGNPTAVAGQNGVPDFDQRGAAFGRVREGNGAGSAVIDIGAFEAQIFDPVPAILGDYNQNGVVDASDFIVWRNTVGSNVAPNTGADGNGDGTINAPDYNVWRAHFGSTLPPTGAASGATVATSSGDSVSQPAALPGVSSAARDPRGASLAAVETRNNPPAIPEAVEKSIGVQPGRRSSPLAMPVLTTLCQDDALVAWLAEQQLVEGVSEGSPSAKHDGRPADDAQARISESAWDAGFESLAATL